MGLEVGTRLRDNLVLERKLGAGAMGTLWLARNTALGSEVAVKVLHQGASSEKARARFEQEARGAASIVSPHVVTIFDYGITDDDEAFIVMELLRGHDLGERIKAEGPLSLEDTVEVIQQLCRGLAKAHGCGIIHRDIKPANVFLVDNDDVLLVKVLDFGVAKYFGDDALGMTATGAMVGTPYYMSPEQLIDSSSVDERSDVWAVGAVAYACLTGNTPFSGATLGALSVAIHIGDFEPPSGKMPGIPATIDAWMTRALARNKEERFASVREMAAELHTTALGVAPSKPAPSRDTADRSALENAATADTAAAVTAAAVTAGGVKDAAVTEVAVAATAADAAGSSRTPAAGGAGAVPKWFLSAAGGLLLLGAGVWLGAQFSAPPASPDAAAGAVSVFVDGAGEAAAQRESASAPTPGRASVVPSASATASASTSAAASAAAATSAAASAEASASAKAAVAAAARRRPDPRGPRWRSSGTACAKYDKHRSCANCCRSGMGRVLIMKPYPSCECLMDGWKWDREHGRAP